MTVDDIREAVKEAEEKHKKTGSGRGVTGDGSNKSQSVGAQFLRQVSSSCKAYGTSKEAAEYARRKCFALQDYFGIHSLFLTITPADDCCFRIRLYVNSNKEVSPDRVQSVACPRQTTSHYTTHYVIIHHCRMM